MLTESRLKEIRQAMMEGRYEDITEYEFMAYHCTGGISEDAYRQYSTLEGIAWNGTPDEYPNVVSVNNYGGERIAFRQSGERSQYVLHDREGEIVRDADGNAVMMTDAQVLEAGLHLHDTSIVAFNEAGQPVGWAANEWGADGVWVAAPYQGRSIGLYLLHQFRKQFKPTRRMGQMTYAGRKLALAYFSWLRDERGAPLSRE